MVESENIPYSEAVSMIEQYAFSCFEALRDGKRVSIAEVGTLFYDKEKNIQFEAYRSFNHLRDSFGMEPIHFMPVQRNESRVNKKVVSEKMRPSISSKENKSGKKTLNRSSRILGVLAVGAAMVWFSLNLYIVAPKQYETTSLNPFDSQEIVISKLDSIRNIPTTVESNQEDTLSQPVVSQTVPETTASIESHLAPVESTNNNPVDQNTINKVLPEKTASHESIKTDLHHFVIAGVFKIRSNALGLVDHLRQSGFPEASITDANDRAYVSYRSFATNPEALRMTDSLKGQNLEGWVWMH